MTDLNFSSVVQCGQLLDGPECQKYFDNQGDNGLQFKQKYNLAADTTKKPKLIPPTYSLLMSCAK